MKHFLLYYDFGPEYPTKSKPLMQPHVAYLKQSAAGGQLVLGGACIENGLVQGVYLLKAETREEVEAFAKADPYFQIATTWRIVEWMTVAGPDALMKV